MYRIPCYSCYTFNYAKSCDRVYNIIVNLKPPTKVGFGEQVVYALVLACNHEVLCWNLAKDFLYFYMIG